MQRTSRGSVSKTGSSNLRSVGNRLSTTSGLPRLSTVGASRGSASKSARPSYERGRKQSVSSLRVTPNRNCLTPLGLASKLQVPQLLNRCSIDTVRSSFGGRSRKEGWPLSDPSFKTQCIDKVFTFLNNNPPQFQYSRQVIRNPTAKDFSNIFAYLYSYIDPSYKLPQRFEDAIPSLLKSLKYPVQMPKSSFQNVGSPHSWPSVLAMLQWLVESIMSISAFDADTITNPIDFGESNESLKVDALIQHFSKSENCEDEDGLEMVCQQYRSHLESVEGLSDDFFEQLCEEEQIIRQNIEAIPCHLQRLKEMKARHAQLNTDNEKMDSYNKELQVYINQKDSEKEELSGEIERFDYDICDIRSKCNELKQCIDEEGMSDSEIRVFKNKAAELQSISNQKKLEFKDLEEKKWALEMDVAKRRQNINLYVAKYNSSCSLLEINCKISSNDLISIMDSEESVISELRNIKKKMRDENHEIEKHKADKDDEIEKAEEKLNGKKGENLKLESKKTRLKDDINHIKEQMKIEEMEFHKQHSKEQSALSENRNPHLQMNLREYQNILEEIGKELETLKIRSDDFIKKGEEKKLFTLKNMKKMEASLKLLDEELEINMQEESARHLEYCKNILLKKGK